MPRSISTGVLTLTFEAPGFLRISYATSTEQLKEGVARIQAFIGKLEAEGKVPAVTRA